MKTILFICFLPIFTFAQEVPMKDGRAIFSQVDSVVAGTKDEIYDKAKKWIARSFKTTPHQITLDDKQSGQITVAGSGSISTELLASPIEKVEFTLNIIAGNGMFSSEVYDIVGWPLQQEDSKTSLEQMYSRFSKGSTKGKKDKTYSSAKKDTDRTNLGEVTAYINAIQESLSEALNAK